jgi:hypothetical protein
MRVNKTLRSRVTRVVATIGAAAMFVGVGGAAFAGNTYESFDVVMPIAQIANHTQSQTKTTSGASGNINVTFVGSTYTVDALMCSAYGAYCGGGTKVFGLDDGDSSTLPNSYTSGTGAIVAELRVGTFNAATVRTYGTWRSR